MKELAVTSSIVSLLFCLLGFLSNPHATCADNPPFCTPQDYKIASASLVAIRCEEDASHLVGSGDLYESGMTSLTALRVNILVTAYPGATQWLLVALTPADTAGSKELLQTEKKYVLALSLHPSGESPNPNAKPSTINIEVSNTVLVSAAIAAGNANTFEFVSHLAYGSGPGPLCILQVGDFSDRTKDLHAHNCRLPAPIPDLAHVSPSTIARLAPSPEDIGSFLLTLDKGNRDIQELPVGVVGLVDTFGKTVKIDSKSQLPPEKAPSSKDASRYYINVNYAGGKGSKPGWVLDGKVAPPIGPLYHGFQFSPLASADVGQNQVNSIKYTDSIDFGASFSHIYEPNRFLQGLLFTPGVAYETDKEFDRDNLLATTDFRLNFIGLYNTRQRKSLKQFSDELAMAQSKKIPWSRENSRPVLFGYALDFHIGFEAGGALTGTAVKASAGKAELPLPSYNIARIVPQIHGLFEIGRFSVDVTGTPRYLTTVENTVLERADHSLFLKRIHGWNAYGVVSGSWNFDPAGHFALTVAYKDGFAPPRFSRVNTAQAGVTLKY